MKKIISCLLLLLLTCSATFTKAQDFITPLIKNAVRVVVWGSGGCVGSFPATKSTYGIWRGGVALSISLKPKANKLIDTIKEDTICVQDSLSTKYKFYSSSLKPYKDTTTIDNHRFIRSYTNISSNYNGNRKPPANNPFFRQLSDNSIITIGYELSQNYRYTLDTYLSPISSIQGFYTGWFSLYKIGKKQKADCIIGITLGIFSIPATNSFINDVQGVIPVQFSSGKIISPEVYFFGLSYKSGFSWELSYKYLNFISIQYSGVDGDVISLEKYNSLPRQINLSGLYLSLVISITTKGIFGKNS